VPGRNKTHAIRRLLGQCPECGGQTPPGRFYCDTCREAMNARHRKGKS
jgi:predicted nucleic acid-binding Zn ribbon protein